jgi:hypothetical protein
VKTLLNQFVAHPAGAFFFMICAALCEVLADSYFQTALFRSSGAWRVFSFVLGAALLFLYGTMVNLPHWDFGKLLGVYVVVFFVIAQIVAKIRFHQSATMPIYVGGALIFAGGLVIALWK